MTWLGGKPVFPCPVCHEPLQVRETRKKKPYVICNACGVQLFIRNRAGIHAFNELARAASGDVWPLLASLKERYRKKCPACGHKFWVEETLVKTSWVDGAFEGFRCPQEDCRTTVRWEEGS
jgi:DNA-directed RNA polymerase subunit RPC12/RpoP